MIYSLLIKIVMIDNPYLRTLRLPVKFPLLVIIIIILVNSLSFFLPWATSLTIKIKIIISSVILINLCFFIYKRLFFDKKVGDKELVLTGDDKWIVKRYDGKSIPAELVDSSCVSSFFVILILKYEEKNHFFIFTSNSLEKDQFRYLKVRLRFKLKDNDPL